MSTAGKVLTILILLVSIAWLVMMAAVTQLNVNWQTKIAAQVLDFEKATGELDRAQGQFLSLTEQARATQDSTDRELRLRLTRLASADRLRSSKTEDLTRVKEQVKDMLAAVESAKANLAIREAEKVKGQEDLARKRDEIAKAQALNVELKTQLAQLQGRLQEALGRQLGQARQGLQGRRRQAGFEHPPGPLVLTGGRIAPAQPGPLAP